MINCSAAGKPATLTNDTLKRREPALEEVTDMISDEINALQNRITDAAIDALAHDDSTNILSEDVFEDMKDVVAETVEEIFAQASIDEVDCLHVKCAYAVEDMINSFAISDYYDDRVLNSLKATMSKAILNFDADDDDTDK